MSEVSTMNEKFEPSPDFVAKVMRKVHDFEAAQIPLVERIIGSRQIRYLLAGGGTIVGILKAVPVF